MSRDPRKGGTGERPGLTWAEGPQPPLLWRLPRTRHTVMLVAKIHCGERTGDKASGWHRYTGGAVEARASSWPLGEARGCTAALTTCVRGTRSVGASRGDSAAKVCTGRWPVGSPHPRCSPRRRAGAHRAPGLHGPEWGALHQPSAQTLARAAAPAGLSEDGVRGALLTLRTDTSQNARHGDAQRP